MGIGTSGKRILIGRKLRSTQLGETLLPKRIALPVFASDALSSVAYAPDEIFLMLTLAGMSFYAFSWKIGIAVALVMFVVVLSYRQNVQAYQSGGGDYEVAMTNIGPSAALTVASALWVDYILTVAVSISSAAQYAATAVPVLQGKQVFLAVGATVFLTAMNLRGVRESGTAFAVPTYLFMFAILGMAAYGFVRLLLGDLPQASLAEYTVVPEHGYENMGALLTVFLLLRAFSSGCAALTGVEAISNGVPAFRKPKGRNAAITLALLGTIAISMAMSILVLANVMNVRVVEDAHAQLVAPNGHHVPEGFHIDPVIGQLAGGVFDNFPAGFYFVTVVTGLILVLAANTAFNGFPVLGSILARDGYMPRALHNRGDRLAFSNGILTLAFLAIVLIVAFNAEVTKLIQLYIVGVFVSFTVSQTGMIRHWTRRLKSTVDESERSRMKRSRVINTIGLAMTGTVLVIVLITKFLAGAWIAILAMAAVFMVMKAIRRHYDTVAKETAAAEMDQALPSRIHAVVLVSKLHKPALRAIAYAKASHPNTLEALTVDVDEDATSELMEKWDEMGVTIPLRVLASPYREITRPLIKYIREIRKSSPRDVVMVYVPQYVVGHWWEHALHNGSAFRLKTRLLFIPGVVMCSVPFQLRSSEAARKRLRERDHANAAPGQVRRGMGSGR